MRSKTLFFVIILSLNIFAGQTPINRWSRYIRQDADTVVHNITLKNTTIAIGFLAGMYALSFADESLNREIKKPYKGFFKNYLDATNELGNARYTVPIMLGLTATSLLSDNSRFQDAAFTSLESMFITGAIVTAMKVSIGRARPFQGGAHDFKPFSGRTSFPSGHASVAFAMITPWVFYYPGWLSYSLLVLPASTAIARMAKNVHWATDVITAGTIGFLTGYTLTRWHQGGKAGSRVSVQWLGNQLSVSYSF